MPDAAWIKSTNKKTRKDTYLQSAFVNITPPANFEYMAVIEDGSKPTPYIKNFEVIRPPGRSCTIVQKANSWADAIEQLQNIADQYGTLEQGALIIPLLCDPDEDDEDKAPKRPTRRRKNKS